MRVKIFTAQKPDFEEAAAEVEHQINAWLVQEPNVEIVIAQPTHVGNFDDFGTTHHYSLAIAYK